MSAQYLLRFDDICPTMDWTLWNRIESALIEAKVSPILAVIPDNQDATLTKGPREQRFWDRVRTWQARGWTIGLHGFQHRYVTGESGIIGLNKRSEFAGLPLAEQELKLRKACGIMRSRGVRPDVWVAPAHSFDLNTVAALHNVNLRTISDGLSVFPWTENGMLWIPQQLGKFHAMPFGVWTVCIHIDDPPHNDLAAFCGSLAKFGNSMTTLKEVVKTYGARQRSALDGAAEMVLRLGRRAVSMIPNHECALPDPKTLATAAVTAGVRKAE